MQTDILHKHRCGEKVSTIAQLVEQFRLFHRATSAVVSELGTFAATLEQQKVIAHTENFRLASVVGITALKIAGT